MNSRRIGNFKIDQRLILDNEPAVYAIMAECIIVRCEQMYADLCFEYQAISEHFDEVPLGMKSPFYLVEVNAEDSEKPVVKFQRVNEDSYPHVSYIHSRTERIKRACEGLEIN